MKLDDPVQACFFELLDGTRDRRALVDAMQAEFPAMSQERIEAGIEANLTILHRAGMLEA